ncbi:MAG: ABC transporter permease [Chloroflexi bacterium]|nr:MAG: ABC transporter permease [Chloroflexota bacterium]
MPIPWSSRAVGSAPGQVQWTSSTSARVTVRRVGIAEYSSTVIADLRALADRRQLLADFAWRELRARYKGSVLGFAWNFVTPLLQLVVFWLLFGVVLRTRPQTATGEQPYAVFLFVGLLPWTFFATSLQSGASAILANASLVKKVRMPVQVLPAASVLSALANFLLSLIVLFAVLIVFGPRHPEGVIWLPVLIALQIVMNLGFAYLLSALAVFYRDVQHILGILLLAWYFLTPVLFSVSILDDRPQQLFLLYLNPMTAVIVGYQRALLDGLPPQWDALAYSTVVAVVLFIAGFWYFDRAKDDFESAL